MDVKVLKNRGLNFGKYVKPGLLLASTNKRDKKLYEEFKIVMKQHLEWYNRYARKKDALMAISVFSQNLNQLESQRQSLLGNIGTIVDSIREFISVKDNRSLLDNIRIHLKKGKHENEIKKAANVAMLSLNQTFSNLSVFFLGATNYVDEESLQQELKDFCELNDEKSVEQNKNISIELELAYRKRRELRNVSIHKRALEWIVSEVLKRGYPKNIECEFMETSQNREVENRGRPMKESAPQEEIKYYVQMLIRKALKEEAGYKKYWHFDDRYGWGPNINQIKKHLIKEGIVWGVDDKTIKRRIKKAFEEIDL
jgi:hypothetical protein